MSPDSLAIALEIEDDRWNIALPNAASLLEWSIGLALASLDAEGRTVEVGVRLVDDAAGNHFPMPIEASGQGEVLVGRLRPDSSDRSGHSLSLFVAGDQLLKGAALNAVQIAEQLGSSTIAGRHERLGAV